MKAKIVKSSELGMNCWSAKRFNQNCASCQRYDRCKYPEKMRNEEYEGLRELRRSKLQEVKLLEADMKNIVEGHGDDRRTDIRD